MRLSLLVLALCPAFALMACQKVNPELMIIGPTGGGSSDSPSPVETDPRIGRITIGSKTLEGASFRLKGRLIGVPGSSDQTGATYRIRGTARF